MTAMSPPARNDQLSSKKSDLNSSSTSSFETPPAPKHRARRCSTQSSAPVPGHCTLPRDTVTQPARSIAVPRVIRDPALRDCRYRFQPWAQRQTPIRCLRRKIHRRHIAPANTYRERAVSPTANRQDRVEREANRQSTIQSRRTI